MTVSKKKNIVSISEEQIKEMIKESIISNLGDKIKNSLEDYYNGYETKEGNPQSVEDVFEGDGWTVKATSKGKTPNSVMYAVVRKKGQFGAFNGIEPEGMVEELNTFLNGKGTAKYIGKHPKYPYMEVFKVQY